MKPIEWYISVDRIADENGGTKYSANIVAGITRSYALPYTIFSDTERHFNSDDAETSVLYKFHTFVRDAVEMADKKNKRGRKGDST